ncbi:MAG: DUF1360 domain-containing protein [Candidatus Moraniibacteriota bacterium]
MTHKEFRFEENIKLWNILALVLFALLAWFGFVYLLDNRLLGPISFADILILSLALLRLIRLFAYDNITLFLREAFMDVKKVRYADGGEETIERVPSQNSLKRTLDKLLNCPWCIGVWLSLGSLFLYFAVPQMQLFFVLLAIASLGSFFQVLTNLIGWSAEYKKLQSLEILDKN